MEKIDIASLAGMLGNGERVAVVDVRSPSEFGTGHIPGAVNVPLEQVGVRISDLPRGGEIVLVCESGRRAAMAAETLETGGLKARVLEGSTAAWRKAGRPLVTSGGSSWSLDRQVRLGAGALVLSGTVLGVVAHPLWFALSGFVGAGLTFAGLTNICGLAMVLQKMPWNRTVLARTGARSEGSR